jgi:hypothetical protein
MGTVVCQESRTARTARPNGPFRITKRAVSHCDVGRFENRSVPGLFAVCAAGNRYGRQLARGLQRPLRPLQPVAFVSSSAKYVKMGFYFDKVYI